MFFDIHFSFIDKKIKSCRESKRHILQIIVYKELYQYLRT